MLQETRRPMDKKPLSRTETSPQGPLNERLLASAGSAVPRPPEAPRTERDPAQDVLAKKLAFQASESLYNRMHPGEFADWIDRESQLPDHASALAEALKSPEVFDTLKTTLLRRTRDALDRRNPGGFVLWLSRFTESIYPRMHDLADNAELSPALKQFYVLALKEAQGKGDERLLREVLKIQKAFNISISPEEESAINSAKKSNKAPSTPTAQTLAPKSPTGGAASLAKRIKNMLGISS